jgi:uncharacterized membrane protein YdjX (TVP38/TMEM64 family)
MVAINKGEMHLVNGKACKQECTIKTSCARAPVSAVHLSLWIFTIFSIVALSLAWRFTPLADLVETERILTSSRLFDSPVWDCLAVIAVYTVGGLISFPIVVLIPATAVVFGPLHGFCYSLLALIVNAVVLYVLGYAFNRKAFKVLRNQRLQNIKQKLARHSFLTIVLLRLMPAAPYTVVNLLAGAFHIPFIEYAAGTLIGIIPSVIIMTAVGDQFKNLVTGNASPGMVIASIAVCVAAVPVVLGWRHIRGLQAKDTGDTA